MHVNTPFAEYGRKDVKMEFFDNVEFEINLFDGADIVTQSGQDQNPGVETDPVRP